MKRWTARCQERLDELTERRGMYRAMEKAILEGKPYSYTIGPRTKTNFAMSLADIRKAMRELEEEIGALEGMRDGMSGRRTRAVVPRDY